MFLSNYHPCLRIMLNYRNKMILCLICQIIALLICYMYSGSHCGSAASFKIFLSIYSYCNLLALCHLIHSLGISCYRHRIIFPIYTALFIHLAKHSTLNFFFINQTAGNNPNNSFLQYCRIKAVIFNTTIRTDFKPLLCETIPDKYFKRLFQNWGY